MSKACAHCGAELAQRKPSRMARAKFCSTKCAYAFKRATNPLRRPCVLCGGEMPERLHKSRKTCSAKCGYEFRKRRTRRKQACPACGTEFWPVTLGQKCCSRKCYRAVQAKRPAMVEASCVKCGAKFTRTIAALKRVKHAFCGDDCRKSYYVGENSPMFRGDKDPNRGANWNRLAQSIRERDCFACQRCGRCESGQVDKLSVDHIWPWRMFKDKAEANHPDNLVSLCRKCHSYKTSKVERALLTGDLLGLKQWVKSLRLPTAATFTKTARLSKYLDMPEIQF